MLLPLDRFMSDDEVAELVGSQVWPVIGALDACDETRERAQRLADKILCDLHAGGFTRVRVRLLAEFEERDGALWLMFRRYELNA